MRNTSKTIMAALATCGVMAGVLLFSATPALAAEGLGVTSTFGKEVNKTKVEEKEKGDSVTETEENFCAAASGDVCQAAKSGSGPGELSLERSVDDSPVVGSGLAVDSAGDVYVADTGNNRVEWFVFNTTTKVHEYGGQFNGSGLLGNEHGKAAPEALSKPEVIAVDNDPSSESYGDVYVVDYGDSMVDKFSATGEFLFQFGAAAERISSIATDPSGDVWVVGGGGAVQEFSGTAKNTLLTSLKDSNTGGVEGSAVDSEGNLYIASDGGEVRKFSKTGTSLGFVCGDGADCAPHLAIDPADNDLFVLRWGIGGVGTAVEQNGVGTAVEQFGPFGEPFEMPVSSSRPNIFEDSVGIAVSPTSHQVYVTEAVSDQVVELTSGPAPETPETLAATEVKSKSAILHGKLKPLRTRLKYYFEYNVGASCAGGSKTPLQEGEGEVETEATGLSPSAEYTFCLVSENIFDPSEPGLPKSFPTPPAPPEVISESASNSSAYGGAFAAVINPDNSTQETMYYFEYSEKANGETLEAPITAAGVGTLPANVFGPQEPVFSEEAFLERGATYYYRVVATNATGTEKGKVQSYTKLPTVEDESAPETDLTLTGATLQASIKVDYQFTKYHVEYATGENAKKLVEEGKGTPVAGEQELPPVGENEAQSVSVPVSGLTSDTTYYYRIVAENESSENTANINKGAPVDGVVKEFTTESLPFVSTGAAQSASRTSETFSGAVTPIDQATTYYFQYISEAGYQAALKGDAEEQADPFVVGEATTPLSLAANASPQTVGPVPASGLLPEEIYHYRLVAKNEFGAEYGEGHTFTTGGKVLPGVSTGGASGVSQNSATLSGTVSTNGLQTNYGFEIGTAPNNYGPATGLGSIGGAATEAVSVTLGELQPGTTYYYRVTATNADGTIQGQPASFTTPGFPTLISPPASPPLIAYTSPGFPKEEKASGTTTTTKTLTNKEKLAKALKVCKKDKSKSKKAKCEKVAKKKYGPVRKRTKA